MIKGVGEMFEGHSAGRRAGKFPLVSMGGRAEGLTCAGRFPFIIELRLSSIYPKIEVVLHFPYT